MWENTHRLGEVAEERLAGREQQHQRREREDAVEAPAEVTQVEQQAEQEAEHRRGVAADRQVVELHREDRPAQLRTAAAPSTLPWPMGQELP